MNVLILGISSKLGQSLADELQKIGGFFLYGIGRRHIDCPSYYYARIDFFSSCDFNIPFDCNFDLTINLMWDSSIYNLNFRNTNILINIIDANIDKFYGGHFIHISSTAVYSPVPMDGDFHIVNELYPTFPITQYGKERLDLEEALDQFCYAHCIRLTIARLGNVIHSFEVDGGFQSRLIRFLFGRYFIYVGIRNAWVNYVSIDAVLLFLVNQCMRSDNNIGTINIVGNKEPLNSFIKRIFGAAVVIICIPFPMSWFHIFRFILLRNESCLGFYLKYRNFFYCNFYVDSMAQIRLEPPRLS